MTMAAWKRVPDKFGRLAVTKSAYFRSVCDDRILTLNPLNAPPPKTPKQRSCSSEI
jgi:hypothetical protein